MLYFSIFNDALKRKKDALLRHIHIKFPESIFDTLTRFHNKVEVSVWKIMKTFGLSSGIGTNLFEVADGKKWRSAWVVINPGKQLLYKIEHCY